WPAPLLRPDPRRRDAPAHSSGPSFSASAAPNPRPPPPGWPCRVPACATCPPVPAAETLPSATRNCAAAGSTRSRWGPSSYCAPAPARVAACPPATPPPPRLQNLLRGNPVNSRALHRHRFRLAHFQPLQHALQLGSGRAKIGNLPTPSPQPRRTHPVSLASQIDSPNLRSHHRQPFDLSCFLGPALILAPLRHMVSTLLNTTAQVGRYPDSGLGESYKSLTNVQSPSWSHAALGAFAPMKIGL